MLSRRCIPFLYLYRLTPYLSRPSPASIYTVTSAATPRTISTIKATTTAVPTTTPAAAIKSRNFGQMASLEALTADVAQQSQVLNDLRKQQADPQVVEEAKKKLGELKKSLALLRAGSAGATGSKEGGGKKKERLLLKTPKVSFRCCCSRRFQSVELMIVFHNSPSPLILFSSIHYILGYS